MVQSKQTGDDELTFSPPSSPTQTDNQSVITPSPRNYKTEKRHKQLLEKKGNEMVMSGSHLKRKENFSDG